MSEVTEFLPEQRLEFLRGCFLDIADNDTHLNRQTSQYVQHGGSLRLCLSEINALSGPTQEDRVLAANREDYMRAVLMKPSTIKRDLKASRIEATETKYVAHVVDKVAALIDAKTPQESLDVGQMPTLIGHASFNSEQPESKERLAANHLYLLTDTALKEHAARRDAIDDHGRKGLIASVLGNRAVRVIVAGGVFVAAVNPRIGVVPIANEHTTEDIELGLKVLSGTILGLDAPELIRMQYLARKHDLRTDELNEELADDQQLSDLALRLIYSSTRYGGTTLPKQVTDRHGSPDKQENLKRFAKLDEHFEHLNNDPGGKPYSGEQALGYAARLLVERKDELDKLLDLSWSPVQRRRLFLQLTEEIITEDINRMKKGLTVSKFRKRLMRAAAIFPALVFPGATSAASEAAALSRDTSKTISKQ